MNTHKEKEIASKWKFELSDVPKLKLYSEENTFPVDREYAEKLVEYLCKYRPKNILDLGSGSTTRIFSYYKKHINNEASILSIESAMKYVYELFDLDNVMFNVREEHYSMLSSYYVGLKEFLEKSGNRYDLVSVDGPRGYSCMMPRTDMLAIQNHLETGGHMFVHDTDRRGERVVSSRLRLKMVESHERFRIYKNI